MIDNMMKDNGDDAYIRETEVRECSDANNLDTVKNGSGIVSGQNLDGDKIGHVTDGIEDITLVPFNDSYKQRVFDFTDKCFEELGKKFEPSGRHSFYNDITNNFVVFYCLLDQDKLIGTVGLKKTDEKTVELKAMYLDQSYRGKGLGRKLMNKVIDEAKRLGYKSIVLDSMSQYKSALKLYEKTGFKNTERYNDNNYADVFMRLEL